MPRRCPTIALQRPRNRTTGKSLASALYFRGEAFFHQGGADAIRATPPIMSALRLGIPVGDGTDAHRLMSCNPLVLLQWMLDGKTIAGSPTRDAAETPTRLEALRLYTEGGAWFSIDDASRGSLAAGKLAISRS